MSLDLQRLSRLLQSDNIEERKAAVSELEQSTEHAALELIIEAIYDSEPGVRFLAKRALKKAGKRLQVDIDSLKPDQVFLSKLLTDLEIGDTPQKLEACRKIARLGEIEETKTLYACLKKETDPEVITAILEIADSLPAPETNDWINHYLLHPDRGVRIQAVKSAGNLYPGDFVDQFRKMFEAGDPLLIVETAPILVKHDKVKVLDVVKHMLKASSAATRSQAVESLRRIASVEARNLLAKVLNDPDMKLRLKVSKALAEVDLSIARAMELAEPTLEVSTAKTIETKTKKEKKDKRDRKAGREEKPAGKLSVKQTEWKRHLTDPDYQVRLRAVQELGQLKEMKLLPSLLEQLEIEDSKYVIASLVKVVAALGGSRVLERVKPFLKHPDSRVRANTVEALGTIGAQDVFDLLFPMLNDDDGRVKANSVRVLWSFSQAKMLEKLHSMVESSQIWERRSALYTLEQIGSPKTKHLVKKLLGDTNLEIKVRAAELFTRIETGAIEAMTADTLVFHGLDEAENEIMNLSHEDYRRRLKAALALYDIGTPRIASRLINLLKLEQNEYVIASLVKVIGRLGGDDAVEVLKPYLKHPDSRVRANTVEAIRLSGREGRFEILSPCLEDTDARVRANAIQALARVEPKRTQKIIKTMIRSSITGDRLAGVKCLEDIGSSGSVTLLKKLIKDQDCDISQAARQSLLSIAERKRKGEDAAAEEPAYPLEPDIPPEPTTTDKAHNRERLKKLIAEQIDNLGSGSSRTSQRAREMLLELLDTSTISYAEEVLDTSSNPKIVLPLLEILETREPTKAVYRVIPYLEDKRDELRSLAENILVRRDTRDMNSRLMKDLRSSDRAVSDRAGRALWFIFKRRFKTKLGIKR